MELEEGECSGSNSESEKEEDNGESEGEQATEGGASEVEDGAVLSAIRQELQKDVSWQPEPRGEPTAVEEETEDRIAAHKLEALGHCEVIRSMLANPHLCQLLMELDGSSTPQRALRRAMNIPVFTEFADQCLKVCGLRDDDDSC